MKSAMKVAGGGKKKPSPAVKAEGGASVDEVEPDVGGGQGETKQGPVSTKAPAEDDTNAEKKQLPKKKIAMKKKIPAELMSVATEEGEE